MRKINRYNVYDNGHLIIENATSGEITKALDCKTICINTYAEEKMRYKERYTFVIVGTEQQVSDNDFVKEWEKMVSLFKNVVWVKSGGRKLCIGKQ